MEARLKSEEVVHSKRGASSSERWLNCPGSIQLIAKLPPEILRKSGSAAALGTAAHTVGSTCLEKNMDAWELSGEKVEAKDWTFVVDTEMVEATQTYIDYVRERLTQFKDKGAVLYIEKAMATTLDPDGFGTGDAIIYVPGDRIIVIDYKNGMITVEPSSTQLKYYAALAIETLLDNDDGVKVIELVIVQPRMPHPQGVVRKLVTDVAEITDWFQNELIPGIARTREPDAILQVGEWCRFCPARESCPAVRHEIVGFTAASDPVTLTDDELGSLLTKVKAISKLVEPYETEALSRVRQGKPVTGWKLVKMRANRVFRQFIMEEPEGGKGEPVKLTLEESLEITYGKEAYTEPALKSPPQIEKLKDGRKFVARWAYSPDSGETLAPLSDKREAIKPLMERLPGDAGPVI